MIRPIWIAGGTTEGRQLAAALAYTGRRILVTVATDYGAKLIKKTPSVTVLIKRLSEPDMELFLKQYRPLLVIDATHPYAQEVTANLQRACHRMSYEYLRLVRQKSNAGTYFSVTSVAEAVDVLRHTEGTVFLTTGSKDLQLFTELPRYTERIALRILPSHMSLDKALQLGFAAKQIVCMQGPFTKDLNIATFRHYHARYIVTKDSGDPGGFMEKVVAAKAVGAALIVISRPSEEGYSYKKIVSYVQQRLQEENRP